MAVVGVEEGDSNDPPAVNQLTTVASLAVVPESRGPESVILMALPTKYNNGKVVDLKRQKDCHFLIQALR